MSAGSTTIFAAGMGVTLSDWRVACAPDSGANDCLEIAALGTGAAYDELWFKSHLLVLVGNFAVNRLNFLEEQLGRPVANSQPGLTNRGQWYGSRSSKGNVVVADNRHIVRHPQSGSHKPCSKPIASRSLVANTAVGRSELGMATISSADRMPASTSRCGVETTSNCADPLCRDPQARHPTVCPQLVGDLPVRQSRQSSCGPGQAGVGRPGVRPRRHQQIPSRSRIDFRHDQKHDRDSPKLELSDPLVNVPDRCQQYPTNPLLHQYQQLRAFSLSFLRAVSNLNGVAMFIYVVLGTNH